MIRTVTATEALDSTDNAMVLICMARMEDTAELWRLFDRYTRTHRFQILRVEPTEEAVLTLRIAPRYPTYMMWENGAELFFVVVNEEIP